MTRNIIYSLIPAATTLFLLASCSGEELGGMEMPPQTDSPQKIRFEMAYATAAEVPDKGTPVTRISTSTDGSYTNSWEDGDEVGVFIVKGNAGLQETENWVDNMKMTYSNGDWSYTLPPGKEYYPVDEALSFYAYYPYTDGLNPISNLATLPTDQSRLTNIEDIYLFTARTTGIQNSSEPVRLEFSSALAIIELSLKSGGDGGRLTDRIVVTMEGCQTYLSFNIESGQTEAAGKVFPITLRRVEQPGDADYRTNYTYQAIVPAQTLEAGKEFRFADKDVPGSRDLIYRLPEAVTLEPGQVKPFEITLKPALDPAHEYKVGDFYPHKGFPIGVVYEVDGTGQHGKIVYRESINTFWGKATTILTDENSGRANMRAVYNANSRSFDGYPAFQWADSLNPTGTEYTDDAKGIWYLPALNELRALCNQWDNLAGSSEKLSLPDREDNSFGSSSSSSDVMYPILYWVSDMSVWGRGDSKMYISSYFFAIMEF